MAMSGQVHWHEGLFLQPHHLQSMQRQVLDQFSSERRLVWAYPYGLVEAKLSTDALENMLVQFDRLRVIMPSGLEVNVPENAELPALNIKQPFETESGAFTISLGVPLWYANRANAIERSTDDWRVRRLYRVAEVQRPDENTGENPQAVLIRRVNARLLLDSDDHTDLETLPLLRIAHATGEEVGLPRQDPSFIPACLVLSGSPTLRDLVRDLANQVDASRKELVLQMTRGGFAIDQMRGIQFEQMLRLRTLNRFASSLPQLVLSPGVTPFTIYLCLRELLGELAALHPDRDPFAAPDYNHDNPAVCFMELVSSIRSLLRGAVAARFLSVPLTLDEANKMMVATLTDEHLTAPSEYFLGIRTKEDPRGLATLVEDIDKFKLMPRSLAAQRVWGIKLAEERHPPLELPAESGLHYFRMLRSESVRMWDRIKQEKSVAARWPGVETSDFKLTIYMILPEGDNRK
jgi:type VI secretion system ImpJ/VasE family protein